MTCLNAAALLEDAARQAPDRVALIAGEEQLTFAQAEAGARRFAGVLAGLGVEPGERVALLLPNEPIVATCFDGCLLRGAVPVPLNVTSPGPEVAHLLADSGAAALVATAPLAGAAVDGFCAAGTARHLLIANLPAGQGCPPPARCLAELMAAAGDRLPTAATRPRDPAAILYTAGTTGRPKGVTLSHANYDYIAHFLISDFWQVGPQDTVLMVAPAAHIFGQTILASARVARAAVLLLPRFEPRTFLEAIARHRVTFFAGVPTLAHFMLHSPLAAEFDLGSLRRVMFGGAPLSASMIDQFRDRFQVEVITGYGLTEGVPICYLNATMAATAPPGTVGLPAAGTELRIVDAEGRDLPAGETGEIVARGPQMFLGYHGQPEATAEAWRGGWFHTGDAGYRDEQGYLFVVDRLKDIIKRSGYPVSPSEVERVLHLHPAVAEAAVVGQPHDSLGEEIAAFVVLRPGAAAGPAELIEFCRTQLAAYKVPRLVYFRDSLPKSPAGKVLRSALRDG